jgi:NADH:ubiquinone oxidoreductase subunit F (NADH-binding)
MQISMDDLSLVIKSQIERYEEKMSHAMAEGNEEDMQKINDDFENKVGKNVCTFAEMAGEPLKSTLIALFSGSCADR